MSISGNGKSDKKPVLTGGPPKPPEQTPGAGDESSEGGNEVIHISDPVVVGDLARSLAQKPFKIIADLMELGLFRNVHGMVEFEIASKVARKYGFRTEKIG